MSNKTGGSLKDTVVEMAAKIVKGAEPNTKPEQKADSQAVVDAKAELRSATATVAAKMTAPSEPVRPQSPTSNAQTKIVTPRLRREILARDLCCQYRDKISGKICGSKTYLEVS